MRIDLNKFFGEAPIASAISLPEGFAQVALNCDLSGGTLAPMRGTRTVKALGVAGVKSIHKFGFQSANEGDWWFAFNQPVHVAKTQIFGDVDERTFFTGPWPTGGSKLRKTRFDLAIQGLGPYPVAYLDGSIPTPAGVPTVSAAGGDTNVEPEVRVYVRTWVTAWDEESEPGQPSARVTVNVGGTVTVGGLGSVPSGSHLINRQRIYRTSYTGNSASDVQFVAEIPAAQTTYSDSILQANLGADVLKTQGWDPAPDGLTGLVNLPNQMAAAHKDFDVYFCVPQAYYAWPTAYVQSLDDKVVGLASYGQYVAAMTPNKTYLGYGTDPESINLVKAEIPPECGGCVSGRSIVSETGGVLYANRFGLVSLGSGGAQLITAKYAGKSEWAAYKPETMLGVMDGGAYLGFYDTGSAQGGLVISPSVPGLVRTSVYATAVHQHGGRTYMAVGDQLVVWDEGADVLPYTWRSRKHVLPTPANMAVGKVLADSYPVTLKLFAGGQLRAVKTVQSAQEFALPGGYAATDVEIEVQGKSRVRRVAVAESSAELADVVA